MSREARPEIGDKNAGFTILEVLVAITVVATALTAIGMLTGATTRGVRSLEQHVALVETTRSGGCSSATIHTSFRRPSPPVNLMAIAGASVFRRSRSAPSCLIPHGSQRPYRSASSRLLARHSMSRRFACNESANDVAAHYANCAHNVTRCSGFTLIEALIAIALMGVILAALGSITSQWLPNWNRGIARAQRSELVRVALDRLIADIGASEFIPPNRDSKSPVVRWNGIFCHPCTISNRAQCPSWSRNRAHCGRSTTKADQVWSELRSHLLRLP